MCLDVFVISGYAHMDLTNLILSLNCVFSLVIPPHKVHIIVMILSLKIYSFLVTSLSLSQSFLFFSSIIPSFMSHQSHLVRMGSNSSSLAQAYPILLFPSNLQYHPQICHYWISSNTQIMPHIHDLPLVNMWKTHSNLLPPQFDTYPHHLNSKFYHQIFLIIPKILLYSIFSSTQSI